MLAKGLAALSKQIDLLRAVRREVLEQGMSFESANSVRDVGLDATAGQKRSVSLQRKRERNCRKRGVHIEISEDKRPSDCSRRGFCLP